MSNESNLVLELLIYGLWVNLDLHSSSNRKLKRVSKKGTENNKSFSLTLSCV